MDYHERLTQIAKHVGEGGEERASVREVLSWFGAHRRGANVVQNIRLFLKEADLITDPDLEEAFIDSSVQFRLISQRSTETDSSGLKAATISDGEAGAIPGSYETSHTDPTFRISRLGVCRRTYPLDYSIGVDSHSCPS